MCIVLNGWSFIGGVSVLSNENWLLFGLFFFLLWVCIGIYFYSKARKREKTAKQRHVKDKLEDSDTRTVG
jgi:uncharacterized membrane protein SirB2